jgi:hypothetical protein
MRRLTRFVLRLYPAAWRKRYRAELEALIEDSGAGWRVIADLLKESIKMQLTTWSFGKLAAVLGLAGLVAAGVTSAFIAPIYISQAGLRITPPAGSVMQHATNHLMQMENQILSRTSLSAIIQDPRLDLYASERKTLPLEDVIEKMRRQDIRIRIVSLPANSSEAFSVSFSYPDKVKAQRTVQALIAKFQDANLELDREGVYAGDHLQVVDPPTLPASPGIPFLPPDWTDVVPVPNWLRPNRVSKAELRMVPASASEGRGPLTERITRIQNEVLSRASLSSIIQNPRLELYQQERKSAPLEDVIERMRKDIRIGRVSGDPLAFTISFGYLDRGRAQRTLQALVLRFVDADVEVQHQQEAARHEPPTIVREAMNLEVLDPPSTDRQRRNFYRVGMIGLIAGLMLAAVARLLFRLRSPTAA